MKTLITFILLAVTIFTQAQKSWTLEECILHARENNLTIRLQQLSIQLAKLSLRQNQGAFLPSVSAGATHSYNYGRTVDMFTNQFATDRVQSNNFYLSANITVFNGFRLINSWKQAELEYEATTLEAQQTTDDISLSIATAYLQVLYAYELVENAKNQLEVTQLQLERTQKLYNAGSVSKGNYLSIEAQYASEQSQLVSATNQRDMANLTLAQMLDIEDVNSFSIVIPDLSIPDTSSFLLITPEQVYDYASKNQPGVQAADIRVSAAEKGFLIARSGRYPILSLSGSYGTGYSGASKSITGYTASGYDTIGITASMTEYVLSPSFSYDYEVTPFADQIQDNMNKSIGLTLTVPIFSRFMTSTSIRQAQVNLDMARINAEQERLNLQKTIQQAYYDALGAYRQYLSSLRQVEALSESFRYMDQRFMVGMATPVDYSDAKNKLSQAESTLLQAKYEFIFRSRILDYYLGREIRL